MTTARGWIAPVLGCALLAGASPARRAEAQAAKASPAATTRAALWRADLSYLASELPRRHAGAFAYLDSAAFGRAVAELDAAIPGLTDVQVQWRLRRLAALLSDGHTTVRVVASYEARLPLGVLWTDSGAFVVATDAERRALLGRRIVAVNGLELVAAADSLSRYAPHENVYGRRNAAASMILLPGLWRDLGLAGDTLSGTLVLLDSAGGRATVVVPAVPVTAFRPAPTSASRPLYLQRTRDKYWFSYLPESRTLYLQYNQCDDSTAFRQLVDSVAATIEREHAARLVVDVRLNGGGASLVTEPLFGLVRTHPELDRPGGLYVIVGRGTFSSGVLAAVDLKARSHALLVGEPNAERVNHFGQRQEFRLPNSGLVVSYSSKRFRRVPGNPDALYPDVATPLTPAAYIAGRDPALEWILAQPLPTAESGGQ